MRLSASFTDEATVTDSRGACKSRHLHRPRGGGILGHGVQQARWILVLLCAGYFMVILDAAIVRVAIPSIQKDLDVSGQGLQWIANAYMVAFGGLLLLGGRIADLVGRRRVLIAGLLTFGAASLWCGFAWSDGALIAARALQGLGTPTTPAALAILMNRFPEGAERNRALGAWVAAGATGASAGWVVGGPLVDGLGWQWIFWVTLPSRSSLRSPRTGCSRRRATSAGCAATTPWARSR